MQKKYKIIVVGLLALFLVLPDKMLWAAEEIPVVVARNAGAETVPGEVVIKLSANVDLSQEDGKNELKEIAQENQLQKKDDSVGQNIVVLKTDDDKEITEKKIQNLQADPRVEYAQPNFVYRAMAIGTNDTDRTLQWGLDNTGQTVNAVAGTADADVNAPEAWTISEGAENPVVVAVIDDGVWYTHPDLAVNMWDGTACKDATGAALGGCVHGYDFLNNDLNPTAEGTDYHGTMVAGILAMVKNNNEGGVGVAPHAKIMALRIGSGESFTSDKAIKAVDFARQNGAKVINASWGGSQPDYLLKNAIENFSGLFVTSAGNTSSNNETSPVYPCNFDSPNIVCVGATDQNDNIWTGVNMGSNYGASNVDIFAPGVNIFSTMNGSGGYGLGEGTSMAAPFVGGAAALLWGHDATLTTAQVKARILASGRSLPVLSGKSLTGKRLDIYAALGGTGLIFANADPFAGTTTDFGGDVKKGKTKESKVKLNFFNAGNAVHFIVSRRSDFADTTWQPIQNDVNVSVKKDAKKIQTYYVKFRDSNGVQSQIYENKVQYDSGSGRSIKNSKNTLKSGMLLLQSGKGFSKNSEVTLYFGANMQVVKTDSKGAFRVSYKINKAPGKYSWYAVDNKTKKKTRPLAYKIVL